MSKAKGSRAERRAIRLLEADGYVCTKVSEQSIKDRLDDILTQEFEDAIDVDTRWVTRFSDSPLFGAAVEPKREA